MLDLGIDIVAEYRRRELLSEAERDRLAMQAREYAKRNPQLTARPSNASTQRRLRLGLLAVLRSTFAANRA